MFNWICHFVVIILSLFSDLGFASVVKGGSDPNEVRADKKHQKIEAGTDTIFRHIFISALCFFLCLVIKDVN